ncbi:MAG TPA: hypothetical protein VND15_02385 [Candidatus Acidoferrales bacterium]|nr:hypothetical protein [Candidatus Acidoferrales bacterium]
MQPVKILILVAILAVVAATAYYWFFYIAYPPYSTFWGNHCDLGAGWRCISPSIATNGLLTLGLEQSVSPSVNITSVGCNGVGAPTGLTIMNPQRRLNSGQNVTISVQCHSSNSTQFGGAAGNAYSGYLVISYTNPSGVNITIPGLLNLKRG